MLSSLQFGSSLQLRGNLSQRLLSESHVHIIRDYIFGMEGESQVGEGNDLPGTEGEPIPFGEAAPQELDDALAKYGSESDDAGDLDREFVTNNVSASLLQ